MCTNRKHDVLASSGSSSPQEIAVGESNVRRAFISSRPKSKAIFREKRP